jgi:hypothetical protein
VNKDNFFKTLERNRNGGKETYKIIKASVKNALEDMLFMILNNTPYTKKDVDAMPYREFFRLAFKVVANLEQKAKK